MLEGDATSSVAWSLIEEMEKLGKLSKDQAADMKQKFQALHQRTVTVNERERALLKSARRQQNEVLGERIKVERSRERLEAERAEDQARHGFLQSLLKTPHLSTAMGKKEDQILAAVRKMGKDHRLGSPTCGGGHWSRHRTSHWKPPGRRPKQAALAGDHSTGSPSTSPQESPRKGPMMNGRPATSKSGAPRPATTAATHSTSR